MGDIKPVVSLPVQDVKKPWLSKTLWLNVIVAVLAIAVPSAKEFIQVHPELVVVGWSIINSVLRVVSKDSLSLQD